MKLRGLLADFREIPATMAIATAWIGVFVGMSLYQLAHGHLHSPNDLILSAYDGHPFGDMTLGDFWHGEVWRALTATFVHYGLLHLALNLFVLYQFGGEVETWYGSLQFTAFYVLTGGGANVLSALVRTALHVNPQMHFGGGSTVVLGLVALLAVVGWRSRTSYGDLVRSQMLWVLASTAVLGVIVPIVDNWGHAFGALIGGAIGLAHRRLIQTAHRPIGRVVGAVAILLLVGSVVAQVRDVWVEHVALVRYLATVERFKAAEAESQRLPQLFIFEIQAMERVAFERRPFVPMRYLRSLPKRSAPRDPSMPHLFDPSARAFPDALKNQLAWLDSVRGDLGTGDTAEHFECVRTLLAHVLRRPPCDGELRLKELRLGRVLEFQFHLEALRRRAERNMKAARATVEALAR